MFSPGASLLFPDRFPAPGALPAANDTGPSHQSDPPHPANEKQTLYIYIYIYIYILFLLYFILFFHPSVEQHASTDQQELACILSIAFECCQGLRLFFSFSDSTRQHIIFLGFFFSFSCAPLSGAQFVFSWRFSRRPERRVPSYLLRLVVFFFFSSSSPSSSPAPGPLLPGRLIRDRNSRIHYTTSESFEPRAAL